MMRIVYYRLVHLIPEVVFTSLWLVIQCYLFTKTFLTFQTSPAFRTFRLMSGTGLAVAKGSAAVINFNSALLIASMCKVTITWLRSTWLHRIIPFDKHIILHRLSAISITLFSLVHSIAHYINFARLQKNSDGSLTWPFLSFVSGPGLTGHILWLLLILIITTSFLQRLKRRKYELFWYVHYLSGFFLAISSIHGAFCFVQRDIPPKCSGPNTWKWIIGPTVLFLFEQLYREIRARRFTFLSRVIVHQSNVIEIQMKKPSFRFKPGQYAYISCSSVAWFQWHPFTLTSAPEEDFVSVHIRIVGDWTRALAVRFGVDFDKKDQIFGFYPPEVLPVILIDGPYGSVSEDYEKFEVAVCIGAGIGQTPFSSILKSMWYSINHPNHHMKLKKIIYYGISREIQSLEWFLDILKALEDEERPDLLELHCYMTGKLTTEQAYYVHLQNYTDGPDPITNLKSKTTFGRPNFDQIFHGLSTRFDSCKIGVFYCGPGPLGSLISDLCLKYSCSRASFKFHKESF